MLISPRSRKGEPPARAVNLERRTSSGSLGIPNAILYDNETAMLREVLRQMGAIHEDVANAKHASDSVDQKLGEIAPKS